MRTEIILFLLGILVSCSSPYSFDLKQESHAEFEPYKIDFKNINNNKKISQKTEDTRIIFGNLNLNASGDKRTLGICFRMKNKRSFIVMDEEQWKDASPTSRAFTAYHELGHCVCGLSHTQASDSWYKPFEEIMFKLGLIEKKADLPDGCPGSIMHPTSFSEYCMLNHFMYYLEDLKKACNEGR